MTFVDSQHGWLVLDAGVIAATKDGGRTWTEQYRAVQPQASVDDLDFVDAAHGFATVTWAEPVSGAGMTSYEEVIGTVDGGTSWSVVTPAWVGVSCLDFLSALVGYALTAEGLAVTKDGGSTWSAIGTPTAPSAACFAAGGDGWIESVQGVEHTSDGGAHWAVSYAPSFLASGQLGADLHCTGETAWALIVLGAGMSQTAAVIARTVDGGAEWQLVDNQGIGGPMPDIPTAPDILDAQPGPFELTGAETACLSSSSSVQTKVLFTRTSDGGRTVSQHEVVDQPGGEVPISAAALSFISPSKGWLLLEGTTLQVRTEAWRPAPGQAAELIGQGAQDLIVLGTTDGGASWTHLASFQGASQRT